VKSLHFTNAWHGASGGIGMFYRALFETANREGHQLRLLVPSDSTRIEKVGEFGLVYHVEAPRAPVSPQYRMLYPNRFLFPGSLVQRIINDENPDVVEICEKYTMNYLAGLLRTRRLPGVSIRPTVIGVSHERMDENMAAYLSSHPRAQDFCKWYMKWIYFPLFDHHITVSEHTAGELIEAARGHKVRRGIWVAPMGVDCDLFRPDRRRPDLRAELLQMVGGNDDSTVVLYAGRLAPEKNLPLLLDTARRLDPEKYRFAVAGDGNLLEPLKAECAASGLNHIAFLGHVQERDRLADYYANADVFVHPNPREPFGIAPLEAMSAGLGLVAPDSGGVISYASVGNAWLSQADPDAFARSVREIRENPELRLRRTAEARRTAEHYRWDKVTSRYLQLYRELDAITRGREDELTVQPRAWTTPGDLYGREIVPTS
jgi:alpha-1,6-mannosyltransferase